MYLLFYMKLSGKVFLIKDPERAMRMGRESILRTVLQAEERPHIWSMPGIFEEPQGCL